MDEIFSGEEYGRKDCCKGISRKRHSVFCTVLPPFYQADNGNKTQGVHPNHYSVVKTVELCNEDSLNLTVRHLAVGTEQPVAREAAAAGTGIAEAADIAGTVAGTAGAGIVVAPHYMALVAVADTLCSDVAVVVVEGTGAVDLEVVADSACLVDPALVSIVTVDTVAAGTVNAVDIETVVDIAVVDTVVPEDTVDIDN